MQTCAAASLDLTLKRNCSISPQAPQAVLRLLAPVSLGIAAVFARAGAWLRLLFAGLPFAGFAAAAPAAAFCLQGRHAADLERIELGRERLRGALLRRRRAAGLRRKLPQTGT
ncbi:MAG: DUF2244 domain-containing protein [Burkholderiales bacterium]|nr:DUF2244 domain-containing protein [Burkholderiales bacterium]